MICPYCGKEYESGSVCPQCGGKAQAEENAIVCPYCDSVHTGGPRCNRCGADLLSIFTPPPLPEPPVGKYKGYGGYLELDAHAVTICKDLWLHKETKITILYGDIGLVVYKERGTFLAGFLSLSRLGEEQKLIVEYGDAVVGESAIAIVSESQDKHFRILHAFFQQCAERNRRLAFLTK